MRSFLPLFLGAALVVGCSSSSPSAGDAADAAADVAWVDSGGSSWGDAGSMTGEPPVDASKPIDDAGGYPLCDGGSIAADRFVTQVVSFTQGPCGGFGAGQLPAIVEGPPVGGGADQGGTDVVSLGNGGSIVVAFAPGAITDGPGDDLVVFENAFDVAGNQKNVFAEPGEVSVSDDGTTWTAFPCTATTAPWGSCAGWHPVYASADACISPLDPNAGGDRFDLHDVGVTHARYVRIVDKGHEACDPASSPGTNGFDLDAIAILNPAAN